MKTAEVLRKIRYLQPKGKHVELNAATGNQGLNTTRKVFSWLRNHLCLKA